MGSGIIGVSLYKVNIFVHHCMYYVKAGGKLKRRADEVAVATALAALMAGNTPLIEKFGDETVATTPLRPDTEVLLMVSAAEPDGIDRRGLGQRVKQSPAAITRALQKLVSARHIHKTGSGAFRVTGPGEQELVEQLAAVNGASPAPRRRRRKQ